jgi:hypothetical protein
LISTVAIAIRRMSMTESTETLTLYQMSIMTLCTAGLLTLGFRAPHWGGLGATHHRPFPMAAGDYSTVTIVFAGYNTPQPSSNLGDHRTIGRFQLRFPDHYVARPRYSDAD